MKLSADGSIVQAGLAALLLVLATTPANAEMILFEELPGHVLPVEGMAIGTQYAATTGMSFSLEGGGLPVLAEVGGPRTAFQGYGDLPDQPAPGAAVGSWFLTDDGLVDAPAAPLIVGYAAAVHMAGGTIIDIDNTESWRIEAYDSGNVLLETILISSLSPGTGDGMATDWAFIRPSADIAMVRLVFTGPYDHGIGQAFDNFWTDSVTPHVTPTPEPGTLTLLGTGLLALVVPAWRRRRLAITSRTGTT